MGAFTRLGIGTRRGAKEFKTMTKIAAFLRGMYEFRSDWTWADPARNDEEYYTALDEAYDHGREWAHRMTLRRYE